MRVIYDNEWQVMVYPMPPTCYFLQNVWLIFRGQDLNIMQ